MRAVVITGIAGGIGRALGTAFREAGDWVIGLDRSDPGEGACDRFLKTDLQEVGRDEAAARKLCDAIGEAAGDAVFGVLVNNAAVQHLGPAETLAWEAWRETLDVNLGAPFALARGLHAPLTEAGGVILNIGSVHATATKKGFAAYATSKAALHGLTRALAVDFGPRLRVAGLAPAAVSTDMLRAGFEGQPEAFAALEAAHPAGRIAEPAEVAKAALFLASAEAAFVTGAVLSLDGGVLARLHDPA